MKYEIVKIKKSVYADNPEELVTWLRKTDPELWINNEQYMKRYAEKLRKFTGLYVNETTEELFVKGLIEIGYIKAVEKKSFWDFFKTNKATRK